jgi:hypothetical protein
LEAAGLDQAVPDWRQCGRSGSLTAGRHFITNRCLDE